MARLLHFSRYLILIAILGSLVGSVTAMVAAVHEIWPLALAVARGSADGKTVAHTLIEATDLFLLGTVLYIVAIGLYELFIDARLSLPAWLKVESLEDLKSKLVGVICLSLAVLFLGQVADWAGGPNILYLGGGVAAVLLVLGWRKAE